MLNQPWVRPFLLTACLFSAGPTQALVTDPYANGQTRGTIIKQFDFAPAKFAEHPTLPLIYASVPATNSVAIINTQTLALVDNVFIGNNPLGLTVTPDGSRLYVSTGSDLLGVMDTATNTKLDSILIGSQSRDVEALTNDRLFILTGQASPYDNKFIELQPSTGTVTPVLNAVTGGTTGGYRGELAMMPDHKTLYYGNFGLSPSTVSQLNIVGPAEVTVTNISPGGVNGQDVGLSRNGALLAYAVGGGNDYAYPYDIAVMRTSDHAILGSFNTGAYPREVEFAPDAGFAYTVNNQKQIKVWSTETFLNVDAFSINGNERYEEAQELYVEKYGTYLFAPTNEGRMLVYTTGRTVPVPAPGDTDGDGDIDDTDLGTSIANYTGPIGDTGGKTAEDGDTDGDGDVDDIDLGTLFAGYTGPLGPASVPEPASLSLIMLSGWALTGRRRRVRHL